tara:strand:+ start:2927 stop:3511 length:585 start_codon:yes stop_codon:yes gene_type:complete
MAFYLGKDVSVYLETENTTLGVSPVADGSATSVVNTATATFAAKLAGTATEQDNLTSVDLGIGAMDEDITYFGMRTALKAEIKKETTLTLTRKKSDDIWDSVFDKLRYGLSGTSVADTQIIDGLSEPTVEYGYRAFVHLSGTSEVMTIPNCVVQSHSVTMNADGTSEETLELMSMVTPLLSGGNYTTETDIGDL